MPEKDNYDANHDMRVVISTTTSTRHPENRQMSIEQDMNNREQIYFTRKTDHMCIEAME